MAGSVSQNYVRWVMALHPIKDAAIIEHLQTLRRGEYTPYVRNLIETDMRVNSGKTSKTT